MVREIMRTFFKHEIPRDGSVCHEFCRHDPITGLTLPGVEEHLASRMASRTQPPRKPATAAETIARVHATSLG
jgi:hypothetical protein